MRNDAKDGLSNRERQVVEMVADMFGGGMTVGNQQEAMQADEKMSRRLENGRDVSVSQKYFENRQHMAQQFNSVVMQDERMRTQQRQSDSRRMQEQAKARLRGETPKSQDREKPAGYDMLMAQMAYSAMNSGPEMGE